MGNIICVNFTPSDLLFLILNTCKGDKDYENCQ